MHRTDRARQAGFSLVELAIVLVIIGLIVGGVLKGQDLIQSARLNDIQTTLNEVRTASSTFQNKYGGLPGDFSQATDFVSSSANNGDGNNRITGNRAGGSCGSENGEPCQFWAHLSLSGLLGGAGDYSSESGTNSATYGSGTGSQALTASIGGYYTIGYGDVEPGSGGGSKHWVLLGNDVNSNANDTGVLSPIDLRSIDVKGDDGQPVTGDIRGENGNGVSDGATGCVDSDDYSSADGDVCVAWFAF